MIVGSPSVFDLEAKVKFHLSCGWKLLGSPFTSYEEETRQTIFYQALTK